MYPTRTDPSRLGLAVVVFGAIGLLTLRFWASPVVSTVLGRDSVSVGAFLGIPLFLVVIGAGIVLFLWGPDYFDG